MTNYLRKMFLITGLCLSMLVVCSFFEEPYTLSSPILPFGSFSDAQSKDEIAQIMLASIPQLCKELYKTEVQEIYDNLRLSLNAKGHPIQKYLEDFDFLIETVGILAYLDATRLRGQIESFSHMNSFIFYQLLMDAAWGEGIFDDFDFDATLPIAIQPYRDLAYRGIWWDAHSYVITPNGILLIIYEFEILR